MGLLLLAGLVVLVVTTGVAWALAGRIIAPVRGLTQAAQAVTHSDLSARIPVAGGGELAELGTTFNEMVERLDRGFRAQRQFLDDIAHDLRTPLTIARGHLETLGDDAAERDETVTIVLNELDRMGRSVTDLLVLAKAEQPHFLRLEAIDYGDFANDLMDRVAGLAARSWVIDTAPRPGVVAGEADPHRLFEAMLNLATNAVQHTEDGDEIGIGVEAVPRRTQFACGCATTARGSTSKMPRCCSSVSASGQSAQGRRDAGHHDGMGLGLSIVDAIARAHGGCASHEAVRRRRFRHCSPNRDPCVLGQQAAVAASAPARIGEDPHDADLDRRGRGAHRLVPREGASGGRVLDGVRRFRHRSARESHATTRSTS